ncbi:GxxExxY protein [Arenimonas sp.]|uniref:GxxExxY protein n=1 Tax=Arenimonas sp. TaxID=1872635 RepID=UPI002E376699|nr:GxxExxY protein [Arenimonas sp.]HEX4854639.1 GxxExxY protein [Arenimonas sp.]
MNTDKGAFIQGPTTETVIGAFYSVYSELGYGFLEKVYENAMAIALKDKGLEVIQQAAIDVTFRGHRVGEYRADLLVPGKLIVEVKAAQTVSGLHEAQLINYLKATSIRVGLLLNFGPKPQFRRRIN